MQSFLTKNGLGLGNLAPIYVQYPIKPKENTSTNFNNRLDCVGLTAPIAQSPEEKILALIFTDQNHLSKLRNPKTLKSILHELVHKLGNKSIQLNFEKADCLWQRFYNLIEKFLKEDYKDKIEFFDSEIVKILATVFDEAITEFTTLAIKPYFKMEFISSKYKNYLRFLIFSSFQLNYRDDVVD